MSYGLFIDRFIHPFIIYVLIGTFLSYLLALLISRTPWLKDSGSRAMIYSLPFIVPFAAYLLYKPFLIKRCIISGHPLGAVNDWLCFGVDVLAKILTPLFLLVALLAAAKAVLSILACRRMVRKYGYASPVEYPELFFVLESLCCKGNIKIPQIIVTKDRFARSFTVGRRSPVIVLSKELFDTLDDEELETVLAHELGHIVRADSALNWVTVFMRDLMFFTPVVFWIFQDLTLEKEKAADDFAVKLTGKPLAFAQALIKVWRLSPRTLFDTILLDNFMPYPGFVRREAILECRVKRILNNEYEVLSKSLSVYAAGLLIAVLSIFVLYWAC